MVPARDIVLPRAGTLVPPARGIAHCARRPPGVRQPNGPLIEAIDELAIVEQANENREEEQMPRIPYPDPAKLPKHVQKAIDRAPINVMRMMAGASEAVFDGFGKFSSAFYGPSKLAPNLREVAILRVGYMSNSRYETYQHEPMGRQVGLTDAHIEAIKHGGEHPEVLSAVQQAVLNFTDDVVRNVRASDTNLAAVRKFLSDQEVLDLIMVIGLYMTVSRFLETAGVELDGAPLDWKKMVDRPRAG